MFLVLKRKSIYLIITLLTLLLTSCITNKTYTEIFNPNHPEIKDRNLKTAKINIDTVLYEGMTSDSISSVILSKPSLTSEEVDYLEEQDYFAVFDKVPLFESQECRVFYNIGSDKNEFVKRTLETLIEDSALKQDISVNVNIKEHHIDQKIYHFESNYLQTFEIEFKYNVAGKDYAFLAESLDSLTLEFPDMTLINTLAYKGVYKCAKQFVDYFNSFDYPKNVEVKPEVVKILPAKQNDTKRLFKKQIHPEFKIGITRFSTSSGLVCSLVMPPDSPGNFYNCFSGRITADHLSIGYTPIVYYNKLKQSHFLYFTLDYLLYYIKDDESRDLPETSYNFSVGLGQKISNWDLRVGGSFTMNNAYARNELQAGLYLTAAYYLF